MNSAAIHRIRAADMTDIAGIVALEQGVAEAPHWPMAEYAAIVDSSGDPSGTIRRCLLVAETADHMLGFAVGKVIMTRENALAELESVAVDIKARRSGVGRALCEAVVNWCTQQGANVVELEVRAGSTPAIALYRGLGFLDIGRRPDYYRDPVEDAFLMRLNLDQEK